MRLKTESKVQKRPPSVNLLVCAILLSLYAWLYADFITVMGDAPYAPIPFNAEYAGPCMDKAAPKVIVGTLPANCVNHLATYLVRYSGNLQNLQEYGRVNEYENSVV